MAKQTKRSSKSKSKSKGKTKAQPGQRRVASRKSNNRHHTKGEAGALEQMPAWGLETLSVLFGLLALFILLCFLSEQLQVSWAGAIPESQPTKNLMGPVGHFCGTLLSGFLGWSSLVLVVWGGWLTFHLWSCSTNPAQKVSQDGLAGKIVSLFGLGGLVVFTSCIGSVIAGKSGGGVVGGFLANPLSRLFGAPGASLISCVFLLLATALLSRQSVSSVLVSFTKHSMMAANILLIKVPWFIFRAMVFVSAVIVNYTGAALYWFASHLPVQREDEEGEEDFSDLPKPRVRKNKVPKEEKRKSAKATHVVVERNGPGKAAVSRDASRKWRKRQKTVVKQKSEDFGVYTPPELNLLTAGKESVVVEGDQELREKSRLIENKLKDFGINGNVTHVHPGPVVTLFEFKPAAGVKVQKIAGLHQDLAMALRAESLRIIAPIPKRGTVGIEVPNKHREIVRLRDVLESDAFLSDDTLLSVPIGKDTYGNPVVANIAAMPHLLIAGATGTGKSVCINAILLSLLYRANPADLGLILIDPKMLELASYKDIPHLRVPVVTEAKRAKGVLLWAVNEMERRYRLMKKYGVRSIDGYNDIVEGNVPEDEQRESEAAERDATEASGLADGAVVEQEPIVSSEPQNEELQFVEKLEKLPKLVIVIDELADLMLAVGRDIEDLIARLAQKARAAGIHLIVATQRPSVNVITGLIKANFPARLSFRVTSRVDSQTILDSKGAEALLGKGDMLFMRPGEVHAQRLHGAFVADPEVLRVVGCIKKGCKPHYDTRILEMCDKLLEEQDGESGGSSGMDEDYDAFYDEAVQFILEKGKASTSMLQRRFKIGYNRAARIIDTMESEGIVGPIDGSRPRQVIAPGGEDQQI